MSPEVFLGVEFDRDLKFSENSWYGVNGGPATKNEIPVPGVSTHARFTRRLGLFFYILSYGAIHHKISWNEKVNSWLVTCYKAYLCII